MNRVRNALVKIWLVIVIGWVLFALFSAIGCRCAKPSISKSDSLVIRDSFRLVLKIKEVEQVTTRDSIRWKDSLNITEVFNCNENQVYRVNRSGDQFTIRIKDGKIYLDVNLMATESRYREIISAKQRESDSLQSANFSLTHATASKEVVVLKEKKPWYHYTIEWIVIALAVIGAFSLLERVIKTIF